MNYPIVMNTPELRKTFAGVTALPTSFIVDRQSRIAMRHVGMLTAAVTEAETRHLAGLPVNASVEEIEKDRAHQARQRRADHRNSRRRPEGAAQREARGRDSEAERRSLHVRLQSDRRALPRGRPELPGQPPARERNRRRHRQRQLKVQQGPQRPEVTEVRAPEARILCALCDLCGLVRDLPFCRLDVNPAFELLALPAARARIVRIERQRRARLAADARVAELVERQQRDVVGLRVLPHVLRRPGRPAG